MIVDFHIHIGEAKNWHSWTHEYQKSINKKLYERFEEIMNPQGLCEYLKGEGVDSAVVLAELSPITTGVITNEYVRDFCKDREMLLPFASINPNMQARPAKLLEKYVLEWDFRGLKLYPSYHLYHPNDSFIYPVYAKAQELEIPVMVHTGSSVFRGSRLKYANPIFLDDVAVDFPDLRIIQVHSGRGFWYNEAFFLARLHQNIYMEISGLPPQNLLKYFPELEKVRDKVIFGSDWPGVPGIKKNIKQIQRLPLKDSTKKKILYENAARILGL